MKNFVLSTAAVALFTLEGCGTSGPPGGNQDLTLGGKDASMAEVCPGYPSGPYGTDTGSIIDNLQFLVHSYNNGVVDPSKTRVVSLCDYHNNSNYKVMFIGVAAGWCHPCILEQPDLQKAYNDYTAAGGHVAFLEAIIQDASNPPKPATLDFVDYWAGGGSTPGAYKIPFEMTADGGNALGPYYNVAAFPMQLLITTSDMKIILKTNGNWPTVKQGIDDALASM